MQLIFLASLLACGTNTEAPPEAAAPERRRVTGVDGSKVPAAGVVPTEASTIAPSAYASALSQLEARVKAAQEGLTAESAATAAAEITTGADAVLAEAKLFGSTDRGAAGLRTGQIKQQAGILKRKAEAGDLTAARAALDAMQAPLLVLRGLPRP